MIIFILVLTLLAILFSTERGRGFLEEVFLLPFKIIGYPFRIVAEDKQKEKQEKTEKHIKGREEEIDEFKKTLSSEDISLLFETEIIWMLGAFPHDIQEQISLYRKFERGEIDKSYLKLEALIRAEGNNSLYLIKPEKIEELRK